MILWFTDLMNVTEEVTIHRPNVSTLLSSAFIRGDLNAATRGPFIWSLISCLFSDRKQRRWWKRRLVVIILELSHPIIRLVRHVCSDKAEVSFLQKKTAFYALSNVYQTDVWSVRCIRCIESRAKKLKNKTAKKNHEKRKIN